MARAARLSRLGRAAHSRRWPAPNALASRLKGGIGKPKPFHGTRPVVMNASRTTVGSDFGAADFEHAARAA